MTHINTSTNKGQQLTNQTLSKSMHHIPHTCVVLLTNGDGLGNEIDTNIKVKNEVIHEDVGVHSSRLEIILNLTEDVDVEWKENRLSCNKRMFGGCEGRVQGSIMREIQLAS